MPMSTVKKKLENGTAFLVGSVLGASWYLGSSYVLDGPVGQVLPVAGAIALAGLVPQFLMKSKIQRAVKSSNLSLAQRLNVLDRHVIVNVVDAQDRLTEVNDQFLDATGYAREDVIGRSVRMLYHEGSGKRLAKEIRSLLISGQTWQGETPLRRADGSVFFTQTTIIPLFDSRQNWIGSISARTDVTSLNQLMEEHETIEALDELRDDIWIIDAETEKFTYLNKAAARRLGQDDADFADVDILGLEDQDGVTKILQACETIKASGDYIAHFETTFMDVPFHVCVKFLRVDNQTDRFLIMLNDITDRLAEEREKAEFISTVSHELRSPLTSIKGSMGLLLSKAAGELPEKAEALLEIAHRNADRLVLIINDILDLEKISAGRMDFERRDVDLSALVQETNEANAMLRQRFALNVQTEGTQTPLFIHTDPNRVIQVLTNLMSNAFKFSKPGGKVTLRLRDMSDHVAVFVTDQGPGIPDKDQHKIFDRFADLENSDRVGKGGTGLGLSICKAIIENLGGTIGFETQEGIGTTFYFVLPKTEGLSQDFEDVKVLSEAS